MAKRRNVLAGLGALAMGSGALITQAALESDTQIDGADFRVIAASELTVRRGDAFSTDPSGFDTYTDDDDGEDFIQNDGSGIEWSNLNASHLPMAFADSGENDGLTIQIARLNNSDQVAFDDLLEVENEGSTDEDVAIEYVDGQGTHGYAPLNNSESWGADTYDTNDTDNITRADIQEIFQFEASSTRISPDYTHDAEGEEEDHDNAHSLGFNETVQLDLKTDMRGDQHVSVLAGEAPSSDPFDSDDGVNFELLDAMWVGTPE